MQKSKIFLHPRHFCLYQRSKYSDPSPGTTECGEIYAKHQIYLDKPLPGTSNLSCSLTIVAAHALKFSHLFSPGFNSCKKLDLQLSIVISDYSSFVQAAQHSIFGSFRAEFRVWQKGGDVYYAMFEKVRSLSPRYHIPLGKSAGKLEVAVHLGTLVSLQRCSLPRSKTKMSASDLRGSGSAERGLELSL